MTLRGSTLMLLVVLMMLIELTSMVLVAAIDQPKPHCRKTCGNLAIPFPFGTSPDCFPNKNFLITCNDTHYNPPQPFLRTGNIQVLNLSLNGTIRVSSFIEKSCYNATGAPIIELDCKRKGFKLSSYTISPTSNKFTVVGCDTAAYIQGFKKDDYTVGCISLCNEFESIKKGTCSGIGSCQASIPDGVKNLTISLCTTSNYTRVNNFSSCGYAFVSEAEYFNFTPADLKGLEKTTPIIPMVLDYAIGNLSCTEAKKNKTSNACRSENSDCLNSTTGKGDVLKPCKGKCKDLVAGYYCYCPEGCCLEPFDLAFGEFMGISCIKRKKAFKNGGTLLLEKLSAQKGCTTRAIIFTEEGLKRTTSNFSEATIIGKGDKGVLSDNRIVAIKKSKVTDQSQTEQFINEVIVLSEINHRYVVKLIGCCLETESIILVYEFIPNGTLHSHIHDEYLSPIFTWDIRLKVATEAADALAYLHSAASVPIIHRDVKNPEYFHWSQLTDKSDVYSFGVVLAELLTRYEAVSFNKSEKERNLAVYFVSSVNDDKLLEILNHHLVVGDGNVEQVVEVGLLAKRFLNVKAEERPTMKEVIMELERLKVVQQHPGTKE
ncbi:hypothetical protein ACH5RR_026466 [Cinchona calisaya]|uniref:Protein kinase domain-containing protein n=1 Tax=Cinchona calisaya TaxID=153742 RepID=A0ABD2Z2N0_9GENT